jgi:endonuclease/exonuclease/phosphatase (EEP) superfamily protein YafD
MKIISWNLWRLKGASVADVVSLIRDERPDILLMQEATAAIDPLASQIGGHYARVPLPGRIHGLAVWSRNAFAHPPRLLTLPSGTIVKRVCQLIDVGDFTLANVHLSHGQVLNRRQLRRVAAALPGHAAVLGDFNLIGPAWLPGFRDVGPRQATHRAGDVIPLRIDRCLARGLYASAPAVLGRGASDHHPIVIHLRREGALLQAA